MNGRRIEGKGGIHSCFLEKILFSLSEEKDRQMDLWLDGRLDGQKSVMETTDECRKSE